MNSGKGRLVVISAPSGAGKGTVIERLLQLRPELMLSLSATTRAPRPGEVDGESYDFITRTEFYAMIGHGDFLEYAEYVGELYGTPKAPVYSHIADGKTVILEIDVQGALQVITAEPDALTIFIAPPSFEELERRLRGRGTDTPEKLDARLEKARSELAQTDKYGHVVVNDDADRAAREILSIIGEGG
jgi:guanylate kinase